MTGGSRGIGRAIAAALAASGATVMISSRKASALEVAAGSMAGRVGWFAANAGDAEAAAACVGATMERFGAVDILVNNAATNPYLGPLIDIDHARADKIVQVNQWAVLHWTQLAYQAWMRDHGGSVINLASDRRHRSGTGDRLLQRHQGGGHPPHQAPGQRARARGAGQRHRPRAGQDRPGPGPVGDLRRRHRGPPAAAPAGGAGGHRGGGGVPGQRRRELDHGHDPGGRRGALVSPVGLA